MNKQKAGTSAEAAKSNISKTCHRKERFSLSVNIDTIYLKKMWHNAPVLKDYTVILSDKSHAIGHGSLHFVLLCFHKLH